MDVAQRILELRRQIAQADDAYYNAGASDLSDADYDELFRQLRALEAEHPELVTTDSPTQRVGAPLPKGTRLPSGRHMAPMLSIESLQAGDQVEEFLDRAARGLADPDDKEAPLPTIAWVMEPKLDGVSANLRYEGGLLVEALSRGDGAEGEVITHALRAVRGVPLQLAGKAWPPILEVRGEVIMSRPAFAAMRQAAEVAGETPARNPRNAVAGMLKQLDPTVVARRRLDFFAWGLGAADGLNLSSYTEVRTLLTKLGFATAEPFGAGDDCAAIQAYHADLEGRRDALDHEMDGIVAKVDRLDLQRRLGRTARTPRWMLAFKFAAQRADTSVREIRSQVGRTGAITPVAEFEPVDLAGVTVRRASLHNWGLLAERDIRVGDRVEIQRAGDVIPEVVRVHTEHRAKDSQPTEPPTVCPSCGEIPQSEGPHLYCVNLECPAQLQGRIAHLASRRALDIEGLGPRSIEQLIEASLLRGIEDVFTLPAKREAMIGLEGWGERSVDQLCAGIEKAKHPVLARLLVALGIRHVGEQTAVDLAEAFDDLDALQQADEESLLAVHGVGEEVIASIHNFFASEANRESLARLGEAGLKAQARQAPTTGALSGRVFCFTGGLTELSRDEAKRLVETEGATVSSSITKKVTDVVLGTKAGSKADKARKLGLTLHDEQQFLVLIGRATAGNE